ncbi:MAG: hypothetical protein ACK454_01860, partial [Flavobacteriales bacterium]
MKKVFLMAFVAAAVAMTSCSSDESSNASGNASENAASANTTEVAAGTENMGGEVAASSDNAAEGSANAK